jgi:hypothetical protein
MAVSGSNSAPTSTTSPLVIDRVLDFGDLKPVWDKLRNTQRTDSGTSLFNVTVRLNKLDPMALAALEQVKEQFKTDQAALRRLISQKGWATELDRVIKRINNLRISENKRVILAAVYPYILSKLLAQPDANKEVYDDIGFTDAVLYELERESGPLDVFAQRLVAIVGTKNRVNFTDDNVLRDLVAHQVRSGL